MESKEFIRFAVTESLNEVRYINTKKSTNQEPISDTETIRVFHGFNSFEVATNVLTKGLSGKQKARRIYSYEAGNNPYGLFVTVDIDVIKRRGFAHSGVIIEFSTKVSDLEAPVWVGGRSYFIQGEYTSSFKDLDEREQQQLINRQKAGQSPYEFISKSSRPELAETIFDNPERQALYVGNLDPNMIKAVWYNEVLHKDRLTNGPWERMSRIEFLKKLGVKKQEDSAVNYRPNQDFNFEEFVQKYFKGDYNDSSLNFFLEYSTDEYHLKNLGFFPKQIEQIIKMKENGAFDKYIK